MGGYGNLQMMANGFGGSVTPQWGSFGSAPVSGGGFGGSVTPQPAPGDSFGNGGFGGSVHPQPIIGGDMGSMPINGVRPVGPQPVQGGSFPVGGFGGSVHPQPWGGMQGYGFPGMRPVGPAMGTGYDLRNLMMMQHFGGF